MTAAQTLQSAGVYTRQPEEKVNRVVAAWFDATLTTHQVALREGGITEACVSDIWRRAKRVGLLPNVTRKSDFRKGAKKGDVQGDHMLHPDAEPHLGFDAVITVEKNGCDQLLLALQMEHGDDPLREHDDWGERLDEIARSMSRGRRTTGEFLA